MFTIARNHASNSRRTALRRRTDPVSVQDTPEATWGRTTSDHASIDDLETTRQLLSHLTPREAEVVACIDVVGLDVTATAEALGMRPTAVRVARHRALGRLRRVLAAEEAAEVMPSRKAPLEACPHAQHQNQEAEQDRRQHGGSQNAARDCAPRRRSVRQPTLT